MVRLLPLYFFQQSELIYVVNVPLDKIIRNPLNITVQPLSVRIKLFDQVKSKSSYNYLSVFD
jgi:hypothetical protein